MPRLGDRVDKISFPLGKTRLARKRRKLSRENASAPESPRSLIPSCSHPPSVGPPRTNPPSSTIFSAFLFHSLQSLDTSRLGYRWRNCDKWERSPLATCLAGFVIFDQPSPATPATRSVACCSSRSPDLVTSTLISHTSISSIQRQRRKLAHGRDTPQRLG